MKKISVALILFLSLFSSWIVASSNRNYAAIVLSANDATATIKNRAPRPIKRRSRLYSGEVIKTDSNGLANIRFRDGFLLKIRSNSTIDIAQYQYSKKKNKGKLNLKIADKANILFVSGAMPKKDVRLFSRVGVVGIRGTVGDVKTTPVPAKSDVSVSVACIDGLVVLKHKGKQYQVSAGMLARFSLTQAPITIVIPKAALDKIKSQANDLIQEAKTVETPGIIEGPVYGHNAYGSHFMVSDSKLVHDEAGDHIGFINLMDEEEEAAAEGGGHG